MIESKEISVVVQGAIDKKETLKCLKSIRKFLPEAEVILSTWEGSNVSNFAGLYDILILNKDPGAPIIEECKFKKAFVNNFIILEFEQSGIYLNKYPYSKNEKFSGDQYIGLYNFYRYENEYKNYCDKEYKITTKNKKMFENEKYGYDLLRIYKHIAKLYEPKTKILSKIEQIFIGIPISTISFAIKHYKELGERR